MTLFAPMFALIFTLITTAESWADEIIPTSGTCNADETCLWSLGSDGTLTISAKDGANDVIMANYNCEGSPCDQSTLISRPWEASLQQIKSVVIGDNITHIGNDAFQAATNLTSVTGMKDVKTIGEDGVFSYTGLTSITIPEGVTSIGSYAFTGAKSLTSITIPDSVTSIGNAAFWVAKSLSNITIPEGVTSIKNNAFSGATGLKSIIIPDNIDTENWSSYAFRALPGDTDIVCQGDLNKCYENLAKYIPEPKGGTCTSYCINKEIQPALFDSCKSTNYFWDGSTCIREPDVTKRKCCTSCKDMGGWCNRIRYTPAEAAKVLKDDNNNSVTITFKK